MLLNVYSRFPLVGFCRRFECSRRKLLKFLLATPLRNNCAFTQMHNRRIVEKPTLRLETTLVAGVLIVRGVVLGKHNFVYLNTVPELLYLALASFLYQMH